MEGSPSRGEVFLAALAYLPLFLLIPLAIPKRSRFLHFHARQGLYLFSIAIIVIAALVMAAFFVLGWQTAPLILKQSIAVLLLLVVVFYASTVVYMIVNVFQRKMPMLPILGDFAGEG